jgi:hypothetical protein
MSEVAADFRRHFDQYYLGVIPRLLNEEGLFLAFLSMLAAVETLAGTYLPDKNTGDRFKAFVAQFFPKTYGPYVVQLWQFRNRMVHSFNPTPFSILCHNSRMHLLDADGVRMLNAEDFYADVVTASRAYFLALYSDLELQKSFGKRVTSDDGGRPRTQTIVESVGAHNSVAQQPHAASRDT